MGLPQSNCFLVLLVLIEALTNAQLYDGDKPSHTARAQHFVYVNGKYYPACDHGYVNENKTCVTYEEPKCPPQYILVNGLCYLETQLPQNLCPTGYTIVEGLCYPISPLPCPANTTTAAPDTTTEEQTTAEVPATVTPEAPLTPDPIVNTTEEAVTSTTPLSTSPPLIPTTTTPIPIPPEEPTEAPEPAESVRCPPGTIFIAEQCRKLICLQGEYHSGRCLVPACPEGTVWHAHRCQEPAYLTTIIEIDNVIVNEARYNPGVVVAVNENRVEYSTLDLPETTTSTEHPAFYSSTTTTRTDTPITSTTSKNEHLESYVGCCSIVTPRICKNYGKKWVCFNRRYSRCDPKVCTHPLIYLKAPKIIYEPPILIMPPNPPFVACATPNCDISDAVDCSGCPNNRRDTCSPYCYHYMCPKNGCKFLDLETYCNSYPGEFGCTKMDGCIWDWCGEKCN